MRLDGRVDARRRQPTAGAPLRRRRGRRAGGGGRRRGDRAPAAAEDLPIDEYESLAASHVVARLESLTADELRAVQEFEAAHRGRRTVLGKIDQLLA